jgi:hypothetical protein
MTRRAGSAKIQRHQWRRAPEDQQDHTNVRVEAGAETRSPASTRRRLCLCWETHVLSLNSSDPANLCVPCEARDRIRSGPPGRKLPNRRPSLRSAAKDGEKGGFEFQKIIDHPGVVINAPIGPLALLQIGRAYLMQGKREQAKAAYEDFLIRWKNADQEIPILRDAKAEYAKQWTPLIAQH